MLARLRTEPIATVVKLSVAPVIGINEVTSTTVTTHVAVIPFEVLKVMVAVPGLIAFILNWLAKLVGVTSATDGLLLLAVRVWFDAFPG